MDPEAFSDLANTVKELEMFPYFDISFCTVSLLAIREDLGDEALAFARKHPLACWLSYMLVIFASPMVTNSLLAEPILEPLEDAQRVLLASLVWYAIFFTPMDIAFKFADFWPVKLTVLAMKEVYRCHKVYHGVEHAAKLSPDAFIIMIVIGIVKGNGDGLTRELIRGAWTPIIIDFMHPSYYTKICFVASVIFVLHKQTELIPASEALVYLGVVIFFVYFKMCYIILGMRDPFAPLENITCDIVFGGIWNKLAKLLGRGRSEEEEALKGN